MRTLLATALVAALASSGSAEAQTPEPTSQPTRPSAATQANQPPAELDAVGVDAPADVAAPPWNAELTVSGLSHRLLRPGTGSRHPASDSRVTVHYAGWTASGELFDSSVTRGEPAAFPLTGLIRGWQEGIPLMVEGEIRRFWIPAELAYGHSTTGGRPSGMLVFDIELISIE